VREKIQVIDPSLSIGEFCRAERMSESTFFELQRRGLGPKIMNLPGIAKGGTITHRAREEWQDLMHNLPPELRAEVDAMIAARREKARDAARKSVDSPLHVSRSPEAQQRRAATICGRCTATTCRGSGSRSALATCGSGSRARRRD
jgi:hypothetical protein